MKKLLLLYMFIIVASSKLYAIYPLVTDTAGTLPVNSTELETWQGDAYLAFAPYTSGLEFRHGITPKADIWFVMPYDNQYEEKSGMLTVGMKVNIISPISVTISNTVGTGAYFVNGIYSRSISKIRASLNLGYGATGNHVVKGFQCSSLSLEYPISKIDIVTEVMDMADVTTERIGLRYNISPSQSVGITYNTGNYVMAGFHVEF